MPSIESFNRHLENLEKNYGKLTLDCSFFLATAMIGQVQLALRHPENNGGSARAVRKWIEGLIEQLDAAEPGLGEILRMGFDPRCDVARTDLN